MDTETTKRAWIKPTRKLTPEEIEDILEHWDYDPDYDEDDDDDYSGPTVLFDEYGNPTHDMLESMYEARHGIYETMTVEEAIAEIHALCARDQKI